jgi:hypothetical protein
MDWRTLVLAVSLTTAPASAQFTCAVPTTNEWLKHGDGSGPSKQLSEGRVRPVTDRIADAVNKLEGPSVVALSDADLKRFIGQVSGAGSSPGFHPYLVRAVYPTGNPSLDVRWNGKRLDVFARGLGCAAFVKHPIVVFLERRPRRVYVMASAAL